jgi:hypothetical protein
MAIKTVDTIYQSGDCYNVVTVDDANELLELGLGQYMVDHQPGTLYYTISSCGTTCDNEGKTWKNCEGYPSKASNSNKFPKLPKWLLPAVGVLAVFIALIYLKKKK